MKRLNMTASLFRTAIAWLAALMWLAGPSHAQNPASSLRLTPSMQERQVSGAQVDAARSIVKVDGREFRVTRDTRISVEDARTGELRDAKGLDDLPKKPGRAVYQDNPDGTLSRLIILKQGLKQD